MPSKNNPYGDDAGTRVGRPSNPRRNPESQADGSPTGAGQESARGIQGAKDRPSDEKSRHTPSRDSRSASSKSPHTSDTSDTSDTHDINDRPGSEPLKNRSQEHVSGYGGEKGNPKRSSDQR